MENKIVRQFLTTDATIKVEFEYPFPKESLITNDFRYGQTFYINKVEGNIITMTPITSGNEPADLSAIFPGVPFKQVTVSVGEYDTVIDQLPSLETIKKSKKRKEENKIIETKVGFKTILSIKK